MRCNERRPRCAHCERLNLDCTWNRPAPIRGSSASQTARSVASANSDGPFQQQTFDPNMLPLDGFNMGSNSFFDFSGPLGIGTWDEAMLLSPNSWPSDHAMASGTNQMEIVPQPIYQLPGGHQSNGPIDQAAVIKARGSIQSIPERGSFPDPNSTSPFSLENAPNGTVDEELLINTFLQMLMPPILTPVEIGPKWASTRAFFASMASDSLVVRSAIMAFASMQMQRSGLGGDVMKTDWRPLYDNAARHLSNALAKKRKEEESQSGTSKIALKHVLASLFLLTYTDVSFHLKLNMSTLC